MFEIVAKIAGIAGKMCVTAGKMYGIAAKTDATDVKMSGTAGKTSGTAGMIKERPIASTICRTVWPIAIIQKKELGLKDRWAI
jgi:hypothetical protein